jgi:tetratricopeptide (TPR) repeat protein/predicted Ser/Thr protein kinase
VLGEKLGEFTIARELGAGGMGTVYLGESDGERVAIKVVHPHLIATPGFFKRFLREAELGKQVSHGCVVRTLDVDATMVDGAQVNYIVMEFVEGRSLRDLLHDLRTVPETLLREIAQQMAEGVAAIHREGIVHRDLKPENVLITDDHRIRIMDLGVAKLQEASVALTKEGQFAGSFLYAAPEQFQGGAVGSAADLYSLGVMLYELAVGDNPFRYDDPASVIQAQLYTEAPPARERNEEISAFLSEVISTLLAKNIADRFDSADTLCKVLSEAEESEWWAEREKTVRERAQQLPDIPVRRETELHGRERNMEQLKAAWEEARAGRGGVVLLEGEPGIGKTRLVDAFMRSIEREQAHILYGSYPPSGGMGGVSDAVIGKFGTANLQEALEPYLAETPALLPAFAALIRHEAAPTGAQPLAGDALHTVTCNLMRALAAEKPTLWIIEDLHYAPAESHQLVLSLARALASHRVLLLLTARPGIPEGEMANFSRLERFERAEIDRLSAREVIELLRDAFKSELLAQKLGGTIAYKSDGVPFFVHELIRGLKEGRLLSQRPDGTYVQTAQISDIEVPSAVKDLIEGRLHSLTKEERALLEVGAVQGFEFDPDLVARVLERKRVRVLQDLAEIERRTGVVRASGRKYRFDQYQILELFLKEISEVLREEYHALLAEAYADRIGGEPGEDEDAYFLAWHHLHGSEPDAGLPYLERALDYLSSAYMNEAALVLVRRGLAAPGLKRGEGRIQALLRMARLPGPLEEAREALEEAVRLADEKEAAALRLQARTELASHLSAMDLQSEAADIGRDAIALAREAGDSPSEGVASRVVGGALLRLSRHDEGLQLIEHARDIAKQCGDSAREAEAMNWQTLNYYNLGPPEPALELSEQVLEIQRKLKNDGAAARASGHVALFAHLAGQYSKAETYYKLQLENALEVGSRLIEGVSLGNHGRLLAYLGDLERARKNLEASLTLNLELGDRRSEGYSFHRLGEVEEFAGNESRAEELYRSALDLRRKTGYERGITETLACFGRLCWHQRRLDDARSMLEEAVEIARSIDRPDPLILATAYLSMLPGGDPQLAVDAFEKHGSRAVHHDKMEARYVLWKATGDEEHLRAAHELLMFGHENAPDEYKQSILQNVPLHAAILKDFDDRK